MKNYLIAFMSLSLIVFMIFLFSGCTQSQNENNIADIRQEIFDCECEEFNATFVCGMRENPYQANGVANKLTEFGIISVVFESKPQQENISYSLVLNNEKTFSGQLEKNPYSNEYMADVGFSVDPNSSLSLTISVGGEEKEIVLQNKSNSWTIKSEDALEIGLDAFKDEIANFNKNNETYELFVKIMTQQQTNFGKYYWNVSIVSSSGKKHNVVFSTENPEILLKN